MSDYTVAKNPYHIAITDHILDSIHGQIGLTCVEKAIERLPIFKRLHNISQLGLVNRIFPCAVHTRYSHSLGVMHVASQMAKSINDKFPIFTDDEIQVIRLAGLLHDIGHYPMSHNIEAAYKKNFRSKEAVRDQLDIYINCPRFLDPSQTTATNSVPLSSLERFSGSSGFHHEQMGYSIITKNRTLHKVVRENYVLMFDEKDSTFKLNRFYDYKNKKSEDKESEAETYSDDEVDAIVDNVMNIIGKIVIGDYSVRDASEYHVNNSTPQDRPYFKSYSAMVQLIHSEMDADNIDYLLRDATFSGTTYGTMDMDILISALTVSELNYNFKNDNVQYSGSKYLVGVLKKRIGCVEQFLLSKYLAYGQVIYSKYVSILEAMLFRVACKLKFGDEKYSSDKLKTLVESDSTRREFLDFNDSYIQNKISYFLQALGDYQLPSPDHEICRQINDNCAFDVDEEVSSVNLRQKDLLANLQKTELYKEFCKVYVRIGNKTENELNKEQLMTELMSYCFENYQLTKQLPRNEFWEKYKADSETPLLAFQAEYFRLAEGIPVIETNAEYKYGMCKENQEIPSLVVDSEASLLHELYSLQFVYLRKYIIENKEEVV